MRNQRVVTYLMELLILKALVKLLKRRESKQDKMLLLKARERKKLVMSS
jgi:hypothetical protein